jgi:hypothetical protein
LGNLDLTSKGEAKLIFDNLGSITWAALVQVIAFPILIYQVKNLRNNILGASQDRLYAQYTEVCKLIIERPNLYPYFYDKGKFAPSISDDKELHVQIKIMCEAIYGLIEHSTVQKKNLPKRAWEGCWEPYAHERWTNSQELRKFFEDNEKWYAQPLKVLISKFKEDLAKNNPAEAEGIKPRGDWLLKWNACNLIAFGFVMGAILSGVIVSLF